MMQNSRNNNSNTAFVLTLFFPFGGLIYTLNHWREKWAKNAFWLACIYLGAVFIFWPDGTILGAGKDAGRIALRLMDWYGSSITLKDIFGGFLNERDKMDLFQPLLTYLISRFTDNAHVFFAVCAFVFGFFYSRNIWYILEKLPNKKFGYVFVLVVLFFLICPITQINGCRYGTAVHVFVYAMLPYLLDNDKSKLWWLAMVPLVHFSFLYVSIMAAAYVLLVPSRMKTRGGVFLLVAIFVFVVSLFINSLNLSSVNSLLVEYSPESYEDRIELYVDQDVADMRAEAMATTNWYVSVSGIVKYWAYSLLLIFLLPCIRRNFLGRSFIYNIYAFTLLFGAFANIMTLIPSGGRFLLVAQLFSVSLILLVSKSINKTDSFLRILNYAMIPLLIPLIVDIRRLFDDFGVTAILGNFITVFFWDNNVPLIDWVKQII